MFKVVHYLSSVLSLIAAGSTKPVTRNSIYSGAVLAKTVTVLSCGPDFPFVSNFTLILEEESGIMGSFGHSGVVQPHDDEILAKINGYFPVFLNLNVCSTGSPSLTFPKL